MGKDVPAKPASERGFALLVVLWSLVLVTLLTTQILGAGRTALTLADNIRDAATARARTDGAINEALYHLVITNGDHWAPDGTPHALGGGDVTLTVRITSLAGKINPNLASTGLLTGLFQTLGAPPLQANTLALAIIAWRSPSASKPATQALLAAYKRAGLSYAPPGHPIADLSELSNIIGMPPALLARALPYMSLYQTGAPDPHIAGPVVRRAMALSGDTAPTGGFQGNFPTATITAEEDGPGALVVKRTAIVSIAGANAATPFQLLSLTDGAP